MNIGRPILAALALAASIALGCGPVDTPTPRPTPTPAGTPTPTPTPAPTATPIIGAQMLQVAPGTERFVELALRSGNRVTLTVDNSARMQVLVKEPSGGLVRANRDIVTWEFAFLAVTGGTYTVVVDNTAGTAAAESQLSWSILAR